MFDNVIDEVVQYMKKQYDDAIQEALETCGFTLEYCFSHKEEFEWIISYDSLNKILHWKGKPLFRVETINSFDDESLLKFTTGIKIVYL